MVLASQQPEHAIRPRRGDASWTDCIHRPWVILISLLPLLAIDALGIARVAGSPDTLARQQLHGLLGFFDVPPTLAMASSICIIGAILLIWHLLQRDPWRLRPLAPPGIALEGVAWAIPLLILSYLFSTATLAASTTSEGIAALPMVDRMLVSIAAGLDEELIFRMAGIALLHTVLVNIIGLKQATGTMLAIAGTAVLFSWYHDPDLSNMPQLVFTLLAGIYLGVVYVLRGFGVVVWAHVLYDVVVTATLP